MKKNFVSIATLFISIGVPHASHAVDQSGRPEQFGSSAGRWRVTNKTLSLEFPDGNIAKLIQLESTDSHEIKAVLADSGMCVLVIERQKNAGAQNGEEPTSEKVTPSVISYYGQSKDAIWRRENVDEVLDPQIGESCEETLAVTTNLPYCNVEENSECLKMIFVIDKRGSNRMAMGPYTTISRTYLSKNGKYGFAEVRDAKKGEYLFFNTSGRKKTQEFTEALPGAIRLREDGVVEFIKEEYGEWKSDGTQELLKSSLVRTLKIE
jgi:hypothetical protein